MIQKIPKLALPGLLLLAGCTGVASVAEGPQTHEIGPGRYVTVSNGVEFGGMVNNGLATKAAIGQNAATFSYNANGFLLILNNKTPTTTPFAAGQKVWLFAKGSNGNVLMKSSEATAAPEITDASNFSAQRSNAQVSLTMPANVPAGVYALVVAASGDSEATAKSAAVANVTITDTNTNNKNWYNPVSDDGGGTYEQATDLM